MHPQTEWRDKMSSLMSWLFRRHLLATNVGLSFVLSGLGDVLQQQREQAHAKYEDRVVNVKRTLHVSS